MYVPERTKGRWLSILIGQLHNQRMAKVFQTAMFLPYFFDTQCSDLSVVKRTPARCDIVKEYVQEIRKWGLRVGMYNNRQLKEILTNYGKVDLLWFDGDWERSAAQWGLQGYGDYKTQEQGIPMTRPEGRWEFCTTINSSWGYQPQDHDYKSLNQILRMFCDCISMGGNLLLDIGLSQDGTVDERQRDILLGLGDWIREHKEAVFDTTQGIMTRYFLGAAPCL